MDAKLEELKVLAEQFQPDWNIPPGLFHYSLDLLYWRIYAKLEFPLWRLYKEREAVLRWIDSIEDGSYYWCANILFDGDYVSVHSNNHKRFYFDRCEAYTMLWYIDAMIKRRSVMEDNDTSST